ncbi:MAG: Glutamate racemase 2 [Candidatus Accumulibacter appositus]|uniref:Glutamate racemase n=1 Tax=Candidatus Accumulibacter appositus TaxID=1454003 RepID=A0A011N5U4_9PROT|nr:glutamate racemase [Accumulibacter sp.]EXI77953.1 MAG: Glutamate racemase 2 [Candidatus Accumulibacter appositus]HRF03775.1 glutamate racemase [Accumulibacter sp.]
MIGIFDSGLGGLSVLAAVARALPQADLLYFADTAHVPYGDKSEAFIRERVLIIGKHLVAQGCGLIVVACNTATAAAVAAFRELLPGLPVVGVEPGVKPAAAASRSGRIAVLATLSTTRSQRLANLIRQHAGGVQVDVVACDGWATRVENLRLDDPDFAGEARQHLAPLLAAGVDQIVLGCTHYAFLRPVLEPLVGSRATLVDVAEAVARQCARLAGASTNGSGRLTLFATAHPERLQAALPILGLTCLHDRQTQAARLVMA